jgi:hypothetical protein
MSKKIGGFVHFPGKSSHKKYDPFMRIPVGEHYQEPVKPVGDLYEAWLWQTSGLRALFPRLMGPVDPFGILIAPTGSGKTLIQKALAWCCALNSNKVVITVPESMVIQQFGSDHRRYNLNVPGMYETLAWKVPGGNLLKGTTRKTFPEGDTLCEERGTVARLKRFITSPVAERVEDRIIVCTHAALVAAFKQIPKAAWKNVALFIDEAHHSKYSDDTELTVIEAQELRDSNGALAKIVKHYMHTPSAGRLMLTTATWLRGDGFTIVPEKNLHRFETFELEIHEHLGIQLPKGDITFKFSLAKGDDYAGFLREEFLRDPNHNTITYLPPVNAMGWSPAKKLQLLKSCKRSLGKHTKVTRTDALTGKKFVYGSMHQLTPNTKILHVEFVTKEGREQRQDEFFRSMRSDASQVINLTVQNKGREAFDWPALSRALVLKPRRSIPMIIQMLGRLLREYSVGCAKHLNAPEDRCKKCSFKRHVEFNIVLPENMLAEDGQFEDYTGTVFMVMALGWLFRTKLPKKVRTQKKLQELADDLRKNTFTGSGDQSAVDEARDALKRVFGEDCESLGSDVAQTLVSCMQGALWSLAHAAKKRLGGKFQDVCKAIDENPYGGSEAVYIALAGEKQFQALRDAYVEWISLDQLKKEVKRLKITSGSDYVSRYKEEIPGAPRNPDRTYPEWISWYDLFGRIVEELISLDQLKKDVKRLKITSSAEYHSRYKEIPGASATPDRTYPEWISWYDLFGRIVEERISLRELKKEVKRLKITSQLGYKSKYKEIPGAPNAPNATYADEWVSWPDLFGRRPRVAVEERISLRELKKAVKRLKITSCADYKSRYKEIQGAPSQPTGYAEWISWPDLFGREVEELLSLDQLKKAVKRLKITSCADYKSRYKEIQGAPNGPDKRYSEWISWPDLFGRIVEERISLRELKKEVKRLKITSRTEYASRYKETPGAYIAPDLVYSEWISWPDLFGRAVYERISLRELKKELKRLKITVQSEYRFRYKEIHGAYAAPDKRYSEWISWSDLFGRAVYERISLRELKKAVKRLKITSETNYKSRYKEIQGAPSQPDDYYAEWISWPDLFGRAVYEKISLDQLKREVKRLKITSSTEYISRYKEIPGAYAAPYHMYPEWVSWPNLFGRVSRKVA